MLVPRFRRIAPLTLVLALPPLALAPSAARAQPAGAPVRRAQPRPPAEGAQQQAPQQPPQPKAKLSDAVNNRKATYHMDFDKIDILEVIKYLSQWTGKNFILPDNVRGKITIIGPTEVTADEAYAAFLAALESNNLTVTPTGKFYKIVPKKDSIRTPIPTFEPDGSQLPIRSGSSQVPLNEQMVTKLFRLKYNDADPIKNVLQQFITREGEIVPFPPDVLIVSDNALNIHRIDNLLEQLDQPGVADEINVLQVEHASAQELSNTLLQIFQAQGQGQPGGRKPNIAVAVPRDVGAQAAAGQAGQPGAQDTGTTSVSKIIPDERTNKLIVIASGKSFQRIAALVKKLDVPTDSGGVHVYYLENADAEELASTLSALASGQSSGGKKRAGATAGAPGSPAPSAPGGGGAQSAALFSGEVKVTAEKSTNSLLIIASPGDYRNMVRVIQQLDIRRRQVFIEAVIMEVKLNGNNKWSLDFNGGYAVTNVQLPGTDTGTAPIVFGSEVSSPGASLSLGGLASLSGFIAGIQGPPIKIDGLNITLPSFGVVLNALQTNSDVNVISTPHILTSDNEDAEITVGSNVPFQAAVTPSLGNFGGLGGLGTTGLTSATGIASTLGGLGGLGLGGFGAFGVPIQRQPVQLQLKLKPQINESDFIKLTVDEQVEEISSIDQRLGPTTAKRGVKTTIVAKDQSTVVIGGLIQDRMTRSETKVPILGSIPILGKLFRSENTTKEKTNLLLFLTPYIIRDQADFRRIFERKMKERQEFVARFFGANETYQVSVDYDRKRGPLGILRRTVKDEFEKAENGGAGSPGERVITPGQLPPGAQQQNQQQNQQLQQQIQQQNQPNQGQNQQPNQGPNGAGPDQPIVLPNGGAPGAQAPAGNNGGGNAGQLEQAPPPVEQRPDERPAEPLPEPE